MINCLISFSVGCFVILIGTALERGCYCTHYIILYCKPARNRMFDYKVQSVVAKNIALG